MHYQTFLFEEDWVVLDLYKVKEKNRVILRLASSSWKLLVDKLADRIVFVHPLGYQVPPDYPVSDVRHVRVSSDSSIHLPSFSDPHERSQFEFDT